MIVENDTMVDAVDPTTDDATTDRKTWRRSWGSHQSPRQNGTAAGGGVVYGLGMIGAMVFFFRSAETRWDYALAIPKASVWPALLVYTSLKHVHG